MSLELLKDYLHQEFEQVDAQIDLTISSETRLTREVVEYVRAGRSKRLRPAMVLLAVKTCDYQGKDDVKIAAALELIHLATLLHDDVIDEADMRHGRPSVNARWGDDVAILMADFLYSRAFNLAFNCLQPELLHILTQVTGEMCEGEMFQIQQSSELLSTDDYFRIIRSKTANLFSACMQLGSLLAEADSSTEQKFKELGMNFGIAFQITDDTLDYTAKNNRWGKIVGTDAAGGKLTLPLIHTLEVASPEDRKCLVDCLNNGSDFNVIIKHIEEYNGIQHALDIARDYADRAREALAAITPNEASEHITWLTDFVVERTF